jgi:hypothetical protein
VVGIDDFLHATLVALVFFQVSSSHWFGILTLVLFLVWFYSWFGSIHGLMISVLPIQGFFVRIHLLRLSNFALPLVIPSYSVALLQNRKGVAWLVV